MKRLHILLWGLSLCLILVGCGNGTTEEIPQTQQPPIQIQPTAPSVPKPSTPAVSKPKLELPELVETIGDSVTLTSAQADAFYAFLDTQQTEYELFDLYDFDGTLDAWNQIGSYAPANAGIIQSGVLNKGAFLNRLKQNNAEFLAATKGTKYAALADAEFSKVFDIVCVGIDELLERNVDETLLDEKLGNLKILATTMSVNGIMTHQDTILAINLKLVEAFQKSSPDADKFTSTILHEVMHLGQISSGGERIAKSITVRVGPCLQWEEIAPYALFWEWYVEGGAEHLQMDIRDEEKPSVYEPYVRQLDTMSVAQLPTCAPGTIHLQTLNAELGQFFALFGADTKENQIEIMQMMCAFDVGLAQPKSFDAAYKERYGSALGDRLNYNDQQIGAASLTLSKVFYRQLCGLAAQETSLAELFSLITAYETELSRTVRYQNNTARNRPFIDGYNAIQTAFFEQLAACAGMTAEEIRGQYLAWYYSEEIADMLHLSEEKQTWLQERMERNAAQFPKRKAVCEFAQ